MYIYIYINIVIITVIIIKLLGLVAVRVAAEVPHGDLVKLLA